MPELPEIDREISEILPSGRAWFIQGLLLGKPRPWNVPDLAGPDCRKLIKEGFVLAGYGPLWIGSENAVSAAGMIATVSGLILGATAVFGPARR